MTLKHSKFILQFAENDSTVISPLHDIPLYADEASKNVNMVVEIPRWTNAKMEVGFCLFIIILSIYPEICEIFFKYLNLIKDQLERSPQPNQAGY
jgi:hypothetical protein